VVEQAEYEIQETAGKMEIRKYPGMMLATVYGYSDNAAFGMLFDYIAGNNESKRKIPMTTPVISSEKIAMTAPVISNSQSFSFVLPRTYEANTAPEPIDKRIRIEQVPARRVAVIRFRGRATAKDLKARTSELIGFTTRLGLVTQGEPFLLRYNPPFTPGFLRRNELGIVLG